MTTTQKTISQLYKELQSWALDNETEVFISQRGEFWFYTIDVWATGNQVVGSLPIQGASPAMIIGEVRSFMQDLISK